MAPLAHLFVRLFVRDLYCVSAFCLQSRKGTSAFKKFLLNDKANAHRAYVPGSSDNYSVRAVTLNAFDCFVCVTMYIAIGITAIKSILLLK